MLQTRAESVFHKVISSQQRYRRMSLRINRTYWICGGSRVFRGQSSSLIQISGWGDGNSDPDVCYRYGGYSANRENYQERNQFESQWFDNPGVKRGLSARFIRFKRILETIDINKSLRFLIESSRTQKFVFDRSIFI